MSVVATRAGKGKIGADDDRGTGEKIAAFQHHSHHSSPRQCRVPEHRQMPVEVGPDVGLALARQTGLDDCPRSQSKPDLTGDTFREGEAQLAIPWPGVSVVCTRVWRERAEPIAVRADREAPRGACRITRDVDIEHHGDRDLRVLGHHMTSDSIERAVEPVVVGSVIVLHAGCSVSGWPSLVLRCRWTTMIRRARDVGMKVLPCRCSRAERCAMQYAPGHCGSGAGVVEQNMCSIRGAESGKR